MIVTVMQPAYLPWLGYFARIAAADRFIVLDHVAIDRNSKTKFANRNKIRTAQGWTWLTVPILSKGRDDLAINRIAIDGERDWRRQHWRSLEMNYARAPFFDLHRPALEAIYRQAWDKLADLNEALTSYLLRCFAIGTPLSLSSTMGIESRKADLILDLCRAAGATTYVSGPFGRGYLDEAAFQSAGIEIVYHDYRHPTYPQCFPGFEPYMSALDLLLNCGDQSLSTLADLPVRQHA